MKIQVETEDLLSVIVAAKLLGRPRVTIYKWIENGTIHSIKMGGILYIPRSEIERIKYETENQI